MRIISGTYRGRKLKPSHLQHTRPTTDFAREGLFNMLNNRLDLEELEVLDLYSGTGAIGIELISRGVKSAVVVDNDRQSVKHIAKVKSEWEIDNLEIVKGDALSYIERCGIQFGLIFADPPYTSDHAVTVVEICHKRNLLLPGGLLVVEHDKHQNFSKTEGFAERRNYGKVNFSFFRFS
ncbi:MAG: 16S rRNA (guanine(966)-N(2))-methyltransferase RsmD [Vicingaceae bacterium]